MAKSKLVDPVKPYHRVAVIHETEKFQMKTKIERDHTKYSIGQHLRFVVAENSNKFFVWMVDEQSNVVYSLPKIEHDKKFAKRKANALYDLYKE